MQKETDTIRRFIFENIPVRGMLVHLDATWTAMLNRQSYPEVVRNQLGQFLAAASLLSATIKYKGTMTLQIQGDGPIHFMVMEATSERSLRGVAKWHDPVEPGDLPSLFGDGRLVITIDSEMSKERYQGIVALEGNNLSEAIESYLRQSEQLDTALILFADDKQSTGILLQRLPGESVEDEDFWDRIRALTATVSQTELNNLPTTEILHRLFNEDDIRLLEGEPVFFRCRCSRERVHNMLRSLGKTEVDSIIEEQGKVSVTCEFCGQQYELDRVDAAGLFTGDKPQIDSSSARH